jgi:hypothetical protein
MSALERRIQAGLPRIARIISPGTEWPLRNDPFSRFSQSAIRSAERAIRQIADISVDPRRERNALLSIERAMEGVRGLTEDRQRRLDLMRSEVRLMANDISPRSLAEERKRLSVMLAFDLLCEYRQDLRRAVTEHKPLLSLASLLYETATGQHGTVKRAALAVFNDNPGKVSAWSRYVDCDLASSPETMAGLSRW